MCGKVRRPEVFAVPEEAGLNFFLVGLSLRLWKVHVSKEAFAWPQGKLLYTRTMALNLTSAGRNIIWRLLDAANMTHMLCAVHKYIYIHFLFYEDLKCI